MVCDVFRFFLLLLLEFGVRFFKAYERGFVGYLCFFRFFRSELLKFDRLFFFFLYGVISCEYFCRGCSIY